MMVFLIIFLIILVVFGPFAYLMCTLRPRMSEDEARSIGSIAGES